MNMERLGMSEEARMVLAMHEECEFPLVRRTSQVVVHVESFDGEAEINIKDQLDYFAVHAGDPVGFILGLKDANFHTGHLNKYLTSELNKYLYYTRKTMVSNIENIAEDYKELKDLAASSKDKALNDVLNKFEIFVGNFIEANNEDIEYIQKAFKVSHNGKYQVACLPYSVFRLVSVTPYSDHLNSIIAARCCDAISGTWSKEQNLDIVKSMLLWTTSEDSDEVINRVIDSVKEMGRAQIIIAGDEIVVLDTFIYETEDNLTEITFVRIK